LENKKVGLREKKSAETKERIYKSAELLFRENGLENVSLNSIISSIQGVILFALRFKRFS